MTKPGLMTILGHHATMAVLFIIQQVGAQQEEQNPMAV